jgi:2-keto-4-pentenoate hydratase/2-oxohepta-3-ene-1,7-dioic acid hydratase in catechol pathway
LDKIVCIGKNYRKHAEELGDKQPAKPVVFIKPPSVLVAVSGAEGTVRYPADRGQVDHECEIVVRLGRGGEHWDRTQALAAIDAVTLGLDMTLRTLQRQQKDAGLPWTTSKVFPDAAIVGPWRPASELEALLEQPFRFYYEGELRQEGCRENMIFGIAECLEYVSACFPLCAGDLVYFGSPTGVGPVWPEGTARLEWGPIRYAVRWRQ